MARQDMTDSEATRIEESAENSDTGQPEDIPLEPGGASVSSPAGGGPRIVINPTTFRNQKDALCVAFNEAFRVVMEDMQFDPVAEPTERQRKFFSDTAYANDETQLRRTILARICTFDTSVKDPTDEQLQEAVEFLDAVMEAGAPQDEWEQGAVQRIRDVVAQSVGRETEKEPEAPEDEGTVEADVGGGETEESDGDRNGDGSEIDHRQDVYAQQQLEAKEELEGMDLSKNNSFANGSATTEDDPAKNFERDTQARLDAERAEDDPAKNFERDTQARLDAERAEGPARESSAREEGRPDATGVAEQMRQNARDRFDKAEKRREAATFRAQGLDGQSANEMAVYGRVLTEEERKRKAFLS